MPSKVRIVRVKKKPCLVKVGLHLIDPSDVACITRLRTKNVYVVRLKSQPNMEYPIWINGDQILPLLDHFDIKVADIPSDDEI